ncbi:MAG TPA: AAA family ATPase, partial [Chitinophagales bacterium]|nr:AAA family ATPase [Chitinophagales bacterium]
MFIIGIAGGSGSGKSTFVRNLVKQLDVDTVSLLMQDAYYRHMPEMPEAERKQMNFDHPDAIEWELLAKHM